MEQNKYKEGQIVLAKEYPGIKLIIRRYVDRIYYCRLKDGSRENDLIYFERELEAENEIIT